jgi:glycosyltransferase involved in cell wall biosynthesis
MNILVLSKYPPIEGGVSSKTYWLAKALGERGHKVFIVSNCWEVEPRFRENVDDELQELEPKNVELFSTSPEFRSSIPFSRYYESRIVSMALDVMNKYEIDVIYSHYLLPYGVSALMLKKLTNRPWVLRHAGSDITRLFSFSQLKSVFIECFRAADRIIGYTNTAQALTEHNIPLTRVVPISQSINLSEFHPNVAPFNFSEQNIGQDTSVFTYFGKISGLKKTNELVDAASQIKDKDFKIVFFTEIGRNTEILKSYAEEKNIGEKCAFYGFVPPWKVPSIMKASTCVVCPESDEAPYLPKGTHGPQIAREAMAVGKPAIIGKGVKDKGFYTGTTDNENILVVNPTDKHDFSEKLKYVIDNRQEIEELGRNARIYSEKNEDFEQAISSVENIFLSLSLSK